MHLEQIMYKLHLYVRKNDGYINYKRDICYKLLADRVRIIKAHMLWYKSICIRLIL